MVSVSIDNYAAYARGLSVSDTPYDIKITGLTEENCKGSLIEYESFPPYEFTLSTLEQVLASGYKAGVKINLWIDSAEYLIAYQQHFDLPQYNTFKSLINGIVTINLSGNTSYEYNQNAGDIIPAYCFPDLKEINLTGCSDAVSVNGIVYNTELTTMMECPRAYEGTVTLPSTVKTLNPRGSYIDGVYRSLGPFQSTPITSINISDTAITSIPEYCFNGCTNFSSSYELEIPSTVLSIGLAAFSSSNIRSVRIYGNPTMSTPQTSATGLFANCTNLVVFVCMALENIPAYTFYNCSELYDIDLSPVLSTIGTDAFSGCSSLYAVMYPNSVDSWCGIAFTNENANPLNNGTCYLLAYEEFPEISPSEIPDYALKNAEITASSINAYAFYNYKTLETVDFSSNTIADSAFTGCTGITEITISGSPTDLSGRFKNLTSLETVYNMPPSVTNLTQAFSGCTSLKDIYNWSVDTSITTMTNCFANCTALENIYVSMPKVSDSSSSWHLITLDLTAAGCTLTVYSNTLDAVTGELVTQRTKTVTYSGDKKLRLFNLIDELAGAGIITAAELKKLMTYRYQFGTSVDGLDPSKKSFVLWASDENEVHSNIGNGILSLTDADFDQIF